MIRLARIARLALMAMCVCADIALSDSPATRPRARAKLETASPIVVGQPVTVFVEVLAPGWFTGAPEWPNVDIPGALTLFQWKGGINFTESIDGETWAGQARRYVIYPQKPQAYVFPEIEILMSYPEAGTDKVAAVPPALTFEVVLPPEAVGLTYFIATRRLELEETFDEGPDTLQAGDAFRRTITATVNDAMGMVVPPLVSDDIPGLGLYADPPLVSETYPERGAMIVGTRIESITYVAEQPGSYRLPPVELRWWNLRSKSLKTAALPAREFVVVAGPDTISTALPAAVDESPSVTDGATVLSWARQWLLPLLMTIAALEIVRRLLRKYGPAWTRRRAETRRRRAESEATYFARFERAARTNDPRATWRELTRWLDRTRTMRGRGPATVREFAGDDSELSTAIGELDHHLFSATRDTARTWSGDRLLKAVARHRRRPVLFLRETGEGQEWLNPRQPSGGT